MGLQFRETMAGHVSTAEGDRAFSFDVVADTPALTAFGAWAPLILRGRAHLEGVVDGAEVLEGSYIEIGLPLYRHLRYQVNFADAQGRQYRYFGQKTVRLLRFLQTMTTLEGRLYRDGEEVGPGTLWFRLGDLPRFLLSWRPWSSR